MSMTRIHKSIAGVALAGAVLLGGAGVAAAQTSTEPAPPANTEQLCRRAHFVWERLTDVDQALRVHHHRVTERRDQAAAAGHDDLAAAIDRRLARIRDRDERVVARMKAVHDRVAGRCADLPDAAAEPLS
jgi:hypothetical protein